MLQLWVEQEQLVEQTVLVLVVEQVQPVLVVEQAEVVRALVAVAAL